MRLVAFYSPWTTTVWTLVLLASFATRWSVGAQRPPINDACASATTIVVGSTVTGTFLNATTDAATFPVDCEADPGEFLTSKYPGVWYTFVGTGGPMAMRSVDHYTYVTITKGMSCNVASLACVTKFVLQGDGPIFTFATELDARYYMLLRRPYKDIGNIGSEIINIPTLSVDPLIVKVNDFCSQAKPIVVGGGLVYGDSTWATSDEKGVSDDCVDGVVDFRIPGVWYTFKGTGGKLGALTFSEAAMSIYKGGPTCDRTNLRCVAGHDGIYAHPKEVWFYTEANATYYLLFRHRVRSDAKFSFQVYSQTSDEAKNNDRCTTALPIAVGSTISGSLKYAAYQTEQIAGCSKANFGVWYTFQGTGARVTSFARMNSYNWVTIYKGSCDNSTTSLQCVAGYDSNNGRQKSSTFSTLAGTKYYMLVQSPSLYTYNFSIELSNSAASSDDNDLCSKATPLAIGSAVRGNNITLATPDAMDVPSGCGNVTLFTRGIWFSVQGTGGRVWIDVCSRLKYSEAYDLPTTVSVYQGSCGHDTLQCFAKREYACSGGSLLNYQQKFIMDTTAGTPYYILVQTDPTIENWGGSLFDIAATSVPLVPNDACAAATPIKVGSTIAGSLVYAQSDASDVSTFCGGNFSDEYSIYQDDFLRHPGVWYSFLGTGGRVNVSEDNDSLTSWPPDVRIYTGSCGPSTLQCVTGYYGWLTRSMEFSTDAGTTYYMLVRQTVVASDIKTTFGISLQPAVPAAAPTSTGRCRRFGCRIGRLFRRIFGIFA